jgi:hypothetical protein
MCLKDFQSCEQEWWLIYTRIFITTIFLYTTLNQQIASGISYLAPKIYILTKFLAYIVFI